MTPQNNVLENTGLPITIKPLSVKDVRSIFGCCRATAWKRRMETSKALGKKPNMVTRKDILEHFKFKVIR